jgi:hypothetical protein
MSKRDAGKSGQKSGPIVPADSGKSGPILPAKPTKSGAISPGKPAKSRKSGPIPPAKPVRPGKSGLTFISEFEFIFRRHYYVPLFHSISVFNIVVSFFGISLSS